MADYPHDLETLQTTGETSPKVSYQTATVSVPVTVTPFAAAGTITTYGIDAPVLSPGVTRLTGAADASSSFTITQNICIAIPIQFGANTLVGDPSIVSKAASTNECKGCIKPNSY